MAKPKTRYICAECGGVHIKWSGKCSDCNGWNTLNAELVDNNSVKKIHSNLDVIDFVSISGSEEIPKRLVSGIEDFDRVCGGGIVPSSVVLVGGDPGIGKSTLLFQVLANLSKNKKCAYVSGEEGISQVRLRAKRLGLGDTNLKLAAATQIEEIISALSSNDDLDVIVIDSIQTMTSYLSESSSGTVSQVRICCQELIKFAKNKNVAIILVGHVTKEGTIAGPRVLEHMVDAVLSFEGQRDNHYRILRAQKNRFGPCDEIGIFEMKGEGLVCVKNPSALFLPHHQDDISGSVIFAGIEGTRTILCEVQALIASSPLPMPRRTCIGYDIGRLNMILAVLQTRCSLNLSNKDVFLNIAGGLKIMDPSADLAVAMAIVSSLQKKSISQKCVFFGEIGLAGEVRPSIHSNIRMKEAKKMGFKNAICCLSEENNNENKLKINVNNIKYLQSYVISYDKDEGI